MSRLVAALVLCRAGLLPTVWTNCLAALVLAGAGPEPRLLAVVAALSLLFCGGMALNDVCDLAHDRVHRPDRPLPAGRLSSLAAMVLVAVLFTGGLAILLLSPHRQAFLAGLGLLAFIVRYDLRHKKNPTSVLIMAGCRFLVYVVAAVYATGGVPRGVIAVASVQAAWIVMLSLAARWEATAARKPSVPLVLLMLAGICLVDGIALAVLAGPWWLAAGAAGMAAVLAAQRLARGD